MVEIVSSQFSGLVCNFQMALGLSDCKYATNKTRPLTCLELHIYEYILHEDVAARVVNCFKSTMYCMCCSQLRGSGTQVRSISSCMHVSFPASGLLFCYLVFTCASVIYTSKSYIQVFFPPFMKRKRVLYGRFVLHSSLLMEKMVLVDDGVNDRMYVHYLTTIHLLLFSFG